jgi:hypothetical protein
MRATLVLAGGGAYSLDNVLLKRNPGLADRAWFRWPSTSEPTAIIGSVVTPFHSRPVSPTQHHFALSNGALLPDGGGTADAPTHIMKAELTGAEIKPLETWHRDADPTARRFHPR